LLAVDQVQVKQFLCIVPFKVNETGGQGFVFFYFGVAEVILVLKEVVAKVLFEHGAP
jgi:hypothetical protein